MAAVAEDPLSSARESIRPVRKESTSNRSLQTDLYIRISSFSLLTSHFLLPQVRLYRLLFVFMYIHIASHHSLTLQVQIHYLVHMYPHYGDESHEMQVDAENVLQKVGDDLLAQ